LKDEIEKKSNFLKRVKKKNKKSNFYKRVKKKNKKSKE
jgi:hypothetical protein